MGKCFDEFGELIGDLNKKLKNGELDGQAVECVYMSACTGYLAYIVDKLDEIASKLEEKGKEKNKYSTFRVGGDPTRIDFLADELREKVNDLQTNGWRIVSISKIDNNKAWDIDKQKYVTTPEYIIIAKKEAEDE